MTRPRLRILADDLTGALDSAARFVPLVGPVPTVWNPMAVPSGVAAIDSGTREAPPEAAAARVASLVPLLGVKVRSCSPAATPPPPLPRA